MTSNATMGTAPIASVVTIPTTTAVEAFMREDLARSGLTPSEIGATVHTDPFTGASVGYRIPYYQPDGTLHPAMWRVKLAAPPPGGGKYSQPDKSQFPDGVYPYLPPQNNLPTLRGPALIVEGEKKTLAAIKFLQRVAYGIGGCWNWAITGDDGLHRLHPDLVGRFPSGSAVEVVLDGDLTTNEQVETAAGTLRRRLREAGITPTFVLLPMAGRGRSGLDDWCLSVHSAGLNPAVEFEKLPRTDGATFRESCIDAWAALKLVMSANELPVNNESNVVRIFTQHDYFRDSLRFNTTMKRMELAAPSGEYLENDAITVHATVWMQERLGMPRMSPNVVRSALSYLCTDGGPLAYNAVADRLTECARKWDGVPRVDHFFLRVLHLPDTDYHRAVSRAFFLGAARRAMQPGCKMDYVIVLAGKGGVGKTTFFQHVAMQPEWVKEITEGLDRSKDARMALSRGWIVEASEGVAFDLASAGGLKSIITDTCDEFRPPYDTSLKRFPRQTVIVASTNDETILKYEAGSGNRRFLPITLRGAIDMTTLDREVEQVWGEAARRVMQGEREWGPMVPGGPDLETLAAAAVTAHTEVDPWCDDLAAFLSDPLHLHQRVHAGRRGLAVSSHDLLTGALRLPPDRKLAAHGKRLRRAMAHLGGWEHVESTMTGPSGETLKFRGYWRPDV